MKYSELIDQVQGRTEPSLLQSFSNLVVYDYQSEFIKVRHLFTLRNNEIPNVLGLFPIEHEKAMKWFEAVYQNIIIETYKKLGINLNEKQDYPNERVYVLTCGTIVSIVLDSFTPRINIYYTHSNKDLAEKLCKEFQLFKEVEESQPNIYLLVSNGRGLNTEPLILTNPNLILEDNYNDDFLKIHDVIFNRINQPNDKGLVLLHGKPGTGKTTYIRHLISAIDKKVIFLPPNLAACMTNPELLSLLIDNPNCVLVIEDAENILMNREHNGVSPVSALLNLTDGLLSDCLNIQVICSFNTDLSNLDAALLRKGKLITNYEFKPLEIAKAQKLASKLGASIQIEKPTILADIYNHNDLDFKAAQRKTVGFS